MGQKNKNRISLFFFSFFLLVCGNLSTVFETIVHDKNVSQTAVFWFLFGCNIPVATGKTESKAMHFHAIQSFGVFMG